jgi:hypothetical protein
VFHDLAAVPWGYNVSYWHESGFLPGELVTCRIVVGDVLGNVLDFTWEFTVLMGYDIQLRAGPNLISVPLEVTTECIYCVLRSVNWTYAEWYDAFDDADHWKTHLVTRPMELNDFRAINRTKGFWLTIPANGTLTVTGKVPTSTTIQLRAGWNYIGYPSLTPKSVFKALAGTGYDMVEGFDENAPYRLSPLSDNDKMRPGEGYRIHVPADTLWIVDW